MARKKAGPRPTDGSPSQQIVSQARGFRGGNDDADPTGPGSGGGPKPPKPVQLDDVDLDKLANEFSQEIEYQRSAQAPFYQDLVKWNKIYRGKPMQQEKTYPFAHASNVVVKAAKIYSDQVIARIFQGITGTKPSWMVQEQNKKFADVCEPYGRYLDWSSKNIWNQEAFLLPYIQDCVKLGTAIGYIDFVNEPVVRYDDQTKKTQILGYRKGPRPTWVPREDFLIPIGFSDLQQAPWIAHRVWCSWDRLEQLAYQGLIQDLDNLAGHSDEEDEIKQDKRRYLDQVLQPQLDDRFGLWAPYYVWFRRDLDRDGFPEQYVMMLHPGTKTMLRAVANPSPSGTRPYIKSSFISVEGEFDGIGIPEDVESLQEEVSTIHNQRRDRSHLANIVMYKAKMAAGVPDTIRPRSGLVIKTPGGGEDIQEFSPAMGQVPIDMAEESAVMNLAAMTVGMNDVDLGKISSPVGRAAATSIMALMQEGARRFDLNVTQIRAALTEEAHIATELWQVYGLPAPEESGSPEMVLDPEPAQLVRALLEQPASLRGLVNIQLNASTAAVNREVEKQSNMQLVGLMTQYREQVLQLSTIIANPQVPIEIKEIIVKGLQGQDKLMDKLFQSFDAFDLESTLAFEQVAQLFQSSVQQQQMMMQMGMNPMMMQQGGQPPQGGPPQPKPQRIPPPSQGNGTPQPGPQGPQGPMQ